MPRAGKREKSVQQDSELFEGNRAVMFGWGTLSTPNISTHVVVDYVLQAFKIPK